MSKVGVRQRKAESKEPTVMETFSKALKGEAEWNDKVSEGPAGRRPSPGQGSGHVNGPVC